MIAPSFMSDLELDWFCAFMLVVFVHMAVIAAGFIAYTIFSFHGWAGIAVFAGCCVWLAVTTVLAKWLLS